MSLVNTIKSYFISYSLKNQTFTKVCSKGWLPGQVGHGPAGYRGVFHSLANGFHRVASGFQFLARNFRQLAGSFQFLANGFQLLANGFQLLARNFRQLSAGFTNIFFRWLAGGGSIPGRGLGEPGRAIVKWPVAYLPGWSRTGRVHEFLF